MLAHMDKCKIEGCAGRVYVQKHGLCSRHYNRLLKTGTTDDGPKARIVDFRAHFWANVDKRGPNDCWPWVGNSWTFGYGFTAISKRKRVQSNRAAWMHANGRIPEGMIVRHTCHNRACCNPKHLVLGSRADNVADMWAREDGAPKGNARLTEADVIEIRKGGESRAKLALRFGVSVSHIKAIQLRRCWKHLP